MEIWRSFYLIFFDNILHLIIFSFLKRNFNPTATGMGAIQSQDHGARSALGRDCRRD
jgi:hypothetical protein